MLVSVTEMRSRLRTNRDDRMWLLAKELCKKEGNGDHNYQKFV